MKLKIEKNEYSLIPIPPALSPFSTMASELLKKKTETFEETEKTSQEIRKAIDKLLSECVTPKPAKEHEIQVFNALIILTNKTLEDAGLFRKAKESNAKKSSSARSNNPQASERDLGA